MTKVERLRKARDDSLAAVRTTEHNSAEWLDAWQAYNLALTNYLKALRFRT